MIIYVSSSIWASPAQTIVNTVNTVGAMGKGIALQFKKKYPDMYDRYRKLCKDKLLETGKLWMYRAEDRCILNFPTKRHWRYPSKPEFIESGLVKFVNNYDKLGITSISFPQLGTGNGGLDWNDVVKPLMEKYLSNISIPVYIHIVKKKNDFTPEYLVPINSAIPFSTLLDDLKDCVGSEFVALRSAKRVRLEGLEDERVKFLIDGKDCVTASLELLRMTWCDLNHSRLAIPMSQEGEVDIVFDALYSLLSLVQYVDVVDVSRDSDSLRSSPVKSIVISKPKKQSDGNCQVELPL